MRTLYIIVDLQNDFIQGALGSDEALQAARRTCAFVQEAEGLFLLTQDQHGEDYLLSLEGQGLPQPHCMADSWGADIYPDLLKDLADKPYTILPKSSFGAPTILPWLRDQDVDEIVLMGLCSDICVITNALMLKAHYPEIPIKVKSSCMAASCPENQERALAILKACQIPDLDAEG